MAFMDSFAVQLLFPSTFYRTYKPLTLISLQYHHRPQRFSILSLRRSITPHSIHPNEGDIPVMDFEEHGKKDWSFMETFNDEDGSSLRKMDRIIAAGEISPSSRVLISTGSLGFVDRVVESSACSLLLVVHDSLQALAAIKEKHDDVKCWHGETVDVPQKWTPFDAVFLFFLPALPFQLPRVLDSLAKCSSPGARIVISHNLGRHALEDQRKQYPHIIVSDLPHKDTLQVAAADHSFEVIEFIDEPGFYLAVLRFVYSDDQI